MTFDPAAMGVPQDAMARLAELQPNRPGHIEVEYGNGWSTPGPAAALCAKVKARGLPCQVGQEYHGVPKEWSQH